MRTTINQIISPINTSDGAGVKLKRSIGTQLIDYFDPFLMLTEIFHFQKFLILYQQMVFTLQQNLISIIILILQNSYSNERNLVQYSLEEHLHQTLICSGCGWKTVN